MSNTPYQYLSLLWGSFLCLSWGPLGINSATTYPRHWHTISLCTNCVTNNKFYWIIITLIFAFQNIPECFFSWARHLSYKNVTNPNFGYPEFWGTKIAVQRPSDRFKVGCPHSTDSELSGHTRHVNQFHHVISQLCPKICPLISRCFLKANKIGLSDSIFVEYRKTL